MKCDSFSVDPKVLSDDNVRCECYHVTFVAPVRLSYYIDLKKFMIEQFRFSERSAETELKNERNHSTITVE